MNEEITNRLINELINVVKALNEKVGVPQPTEETLIISTEAEKEKANVWGSELQIGKYFPDNTEASFLKPLFRGLTELFEKYKSSGVTGIGGVAGAQSMFGVNSDQILAISKNLGLAVPGLTAFKNLDWELVLLGVESLDELVLELVLMEGGLNKALVSSRNILEVTGNLASSFGSFSVLDTIGESFKSLIVVTTALGAAAGGLMIFGALSWNTIAKGVVTLGGLAGITLLLGTAKGTSLVGVATLAALGLALIPIGYGIKQLQDIEWSQLAVVGTAIGGLAAIAIGLGIPAVALLAITGGGVLLALSGSMYIFGRALNSLFELPIDQLPVLGTSLKDFLLNMVSGIGIISGAKLAAAIPLLIGIGGGLMAIATAVRVLMPVVPDFNNFLSGILNVDKANLAASTEFVVRHFNSIAESIGRISSAIDSVNLDAISSLSSKIKDMSVSVINNNPEIVKTNNILSEQLTISRMQLEELRKQTVMLGNVGNIGGNQGIQSENFVEAGSFSDTRRNYRASAYYLPAS